MNATYFEKDLTMWTAFMAAANQDRTSIFCMEHMKLKKRPYPLKKKQLFDVEEYSKELNSILTNQLFGLCDLQ